MKPFSVIILCIIAGIFGFFVGAMLQDPGSYVVACVNITMGACIIYTINKNAAATRSNTRQENPANPENN